MTHSPLFRSLFMTSALLLAAGAASAQTMAPDDARTEVELRADVRAAVDRDTDVANTALVFNNTSAEQSAVGCTAFGSNGQILGRKTIRVPARGLRYVRASDLSNGADFVGSAVCSSRARLVASAVFLAPGSITNLDVIQAGPWDHNKMRFPLIATY